MGPRKRRRREEAGLADALALMDSLTSMCPDCGGPRRLVLGPDDLDEEQRQAYAEVVSVMGQPVSMRVCDKCERIGFMGAWGM